MGRSTLILLCLLLILIVIFAGCSSVPGDSSSNITRTPKTTKATTIATTLPTPTPFFPLFSIGQVALKSKDGSSGLAIVNVYPSIGLYGTHEVKRGARGMWYTDGMQLITYQNIDTIDKNYKFVEGGLDITKIPISSTGYDFTVPESNDCDPLGDWHIDKTNSYYKLRNDNIIVKQTEGEILVGSWKKIRTPDGRSYFIYWNYRPNPDFPPYVEKITVSKDYTKIDGINNYGQKFSGTWTYARGPIGTEKRCSDWPGGDEWYKKFI